MPKQTTTLEEIEAIPKEMLTPIDVASYLGVLPYSINIQCKNGGLPWAYLVRTRVKIPKRKFVSYHRGEGVSLK